jgi:divalent metal cation (Fe/Co/Zn/Cd) transporter
MNDATEKKLKSIWYFVGLILMAMGLVIFATGLHAIFTHQQIHTVLANLHPDLWWGGLMVVVGAVFFLLNRK